MAQRETPAPTLMEPPSLAQVPVPSTLTKPAPYSAQELPRAAPFNGSSLSAAGDLVVEVGWLDCCASASAGHPARMIVSEIFLIPPFTAWRQTLLRTNVLGHELDADGLAAAPHHFTVPPGPGVARKRQPQFGRQRVGIVDRDLRTGRRNVLHHAGARRKAAVKRDPSGLAQRFARFAFFRAQGHIKIPTASPTQFGVKNRRQMIPVLGNLAAPGT